MISGKGFYIWNADNVLRRSGAASAEEAAAFAQAAGIAHAIVKIADGERPFPLARRTRIEQEGNDHRRPDPALREWGSRCGGGPLPMVRRWTLKPRPSVFAARARQFRSERSGHRCRGFRESGLVLAGGAAAASAYVRATARRDGRGVRSDRRAELVSLHPLPSQLPVRRVHGQGVMWRCRRSIG